MNFYKYAQISADSIQKEVISQLKKENKLFQNDAHLKKFYSSFISGTLGGKYMRGTLIRLGYLLANHKDNSEILAIAAAWEILHTALLIHDDIIDKSPMRRGKMSLWKEIGVSQAICLADAGFFLAQKIVAESLFSSDKKAQATSLLSEVILDTIAGEMLDIALSEKDAEKNEKDVLRIHTLKTAYYSISGPLMLGALLGGGNEKLLQEIKQFGEYLGIAFQIQDDILGTFGNEEELGKSVTSDIKENKNTLLIAYALKNGSPAQKKFLKEVYGKENLTVKELREIKHIFEETGSLAYSQKKAKDYTKKAKKLISTVTSDTKIIPMLSELADFIVERQK